MADYRVYKMYINGEFISKDETIPVINPANKQVISYIPKGTKDDVEQAVNAAHEAQKS